MDLLSVDQLNSAFARVISKHGLKTAKLSGEAVVAYRSEYALVVMADRDGLSYVFYDKGTRSGYNLGLFLYHKRRNILKFEIDDKSDQSWKGYVDFGLSAFERHLLSAAEDILNGEGGWIAGYSWPPVSMPAELIKLLSK